MRVLLISSNSSGRGGGERYLVFLAKALSELDVEVHAIISTVGFMDAWQQELTEAGAVVHRMPLQGLAQRRLRFVQSLLAIGQQKRIAAKCAEIAPNAILVNQQYDEDGLDYIMGAKRAKVCPVAGVIHMPMTAEKNARPAGRQRGWILSRWYHKNPYRIIFSSRGGQAEFCDYYGDSLDVSVVVSGVPLETKRQDKQTAAAELNDPWVSASLREPELPIIGTACQFVPQKNLGLLIDAWIESLRLGKESRLLLIGDGPERRRLEDRLSGIDSTLWQITGWTDRYADYLAQLDVFMMTSHYEGLPLTLIEVAGMGIPTIVTEFNGAQEVAAKANWVEIASPSDAKEISHRICEKLNRLQKAPVVPSSDQDAFVSYFSLRRMASDYLSVLGQRD